MTLNIQQELLQWFYTNQRSMPWRENPSPYRVWISEIMLQQTTVATVQSFFNRFMDRFPNLETLSQASEDEVLTLWAGLGYYSRARNILKTAKLLQSEANFPQTYQELLALPGIGPYTAGAISSIAFHQPVSLIDTNVDRVLGRFYALDRKAKDFEKTLRQLAQTIIEQINPQDVWAWNQAIMELGALVCKAKTAECLTCPLRPTCKAYISGSPLSFPGDKIKVPKIEKTESVLIVEQQGKFLFQKITQGTQRKGLYDFVVVDAPHGKLIKTIKYSISNFKVVRNNYLVKDVFELGEDMVWLTAEEAINNVALVSPCKKILKIIHSV